jgi:hypothetical protein
VGEKGVTWRRIAPRALAARSSWAEGARLREARVRGDVPGVVVRFSGVQSLPHQLRAGVHICLLISLLCYLFIEFYLFIFCWFVEFYLCIDFYDLLFVY